MSDATTAQEEPAGPALTWIIPTDGRNPFKVIDLAERSSWRPDSEFSSARRTWRTRDRLYAILGIKLRGGTQYHVFASYQLPNPGVNMQMIGTAEDAAGARRAAAFHHESCAESGWWINPMLWPTAQAIGEPA